MEHFSEEIDKYAVKISGDGKLLGSGVLWKPQECKKYPLYVFTAAHVLSACAAPDLEIEFKTRKGTVCLTIEKRIAAVSKSYKKEGDYGDVAVLPLDYEYGLLKPYKFASFHQESARLHRGQKMCMVGFPSDGCGNPDYEIAIDTMDLEYDRIISYGELFRNKFLNPNVDQTDRNHEFIGFSGSGIFYDMGPEAVFAGIHKGARGNGERGNIFGAASDLIREICMEKQWDVPVYIDAVDGNLSDQLRYFLDEMGMGNGAGMPPEGRVNFDDKLYAYCMHTISQDMAEAVENMFYSFCEECAYKENFHQCKFFRGFLLILTVFLQAVEETVDLSQPNIHAFNGDRIPIYFICSEGKGVSTQASRSISNFIYALKTEQQVISRLEDGCVIIWGSEMPVNIKEELGRQSDYQNIPRDIAHIQQKGIDITSIQKDLRPKAIIHIRKIIRMLQEEDIEQIRKQFLELLEELNK